MKEYLNSKERTEHIIMCCCQETARQLSQSESLTAEEKADISKVVEYCEKFNNSVFKRLGEPYKRKIQGTMKSNDLRLVGKYSSYKEAISECASEDIKPKVELLQALNCVCCDKCDYINCAMYGMCIACEIEPSNENGCPFKMGE